MVEIQDPEKVRGQIVNGLRDYFRSAGYARAVIGASGGLDSSVTLALTVEALSPRNTYPVLLPSRETPRRDMEDARELISMLKIPSRNASLIKIDRIVGTIRTSLGGMTRMERANAITRVRMIILHAVAYQRVALVVGSGDRSEHEIGFFTKFGDGGVDILPLGCLLKTQVRQMARHLRLPRTICEKPSSPRLWSGHMAERELGISYETIDEFIRLHSDLGVSVEEVSAKTGMPLSAFNDLEKRMLATAHKRAPPPIIRCDSF